MAIFRSSLQAFSRSKGESSTAAAAYRAALCIEDHRTGVVHDYRRRRGVEHVESFAPEHAPAWAHDPAALWNAAESCERVNGRPARELLVALPHELSHAQRVELVRDVSRELVARYAVGVMAAVHAPSRQGDDRNTHAHIMMTTRRLERTGLGKKVRALDDRTTGPEEVHYLRARVAELTNARLASTGHSAQVDHRSLSAQAQAAMEAGDVVKAFFLTRAPVRTEGKEATAARRRGERTSVGDWNDSVRRDEERALRYFAGRIERAVQRQEAATGIQAIVAPPGRRSRRPMLPSSVTAAIERGAGAFGPGGHVINQQSRFARQSRREFEAAERRYVRMLEEEATRIERNNRNIVLFYAAAMRLERDAVRALAAHCARDSVCVQLLRKSTKLRRSMAKARAADNKRRDDHGAAMVRTTEARAALAAIETSKPTVLKSMRRREWAELRRRQRAVLADAIAQERAARAASDHNAPAQTTLGQLQMVAELDRLEAERHIRFPVPGDTEISPAHTENAREALRKIGNKIAAAEAGETKAYAHPTLAPRPSRRRRPLP